MAAQTISLRAAFGEAARIGIPGAEFKKEIVRAARNHLLPATAGYWIKALLDFNQGDTLANALRGTSLHSLLDDLQKQEASLRMQGVSYHRNHGHYYTVIFERGQWLAYYVKEYNRPSQRWEIYQSYWDMNVYIDDIHWSVIFEDVSKYTRFEASLIDFELGPLKRVWEELGPALKAPMGRPPRFSTAENKERARTWARMNYRLANTSAYETFVRSLFPDKEVSKRTMARVFMPIWRQESGDQ